VRTVVRQKSRPGGGKLLGRRAGPGKSRLDTAHCNGRSEGALTVNRSFTVTPTVPLSYPLTVT
jgi:hypothetical protein